MAENEWGMQERLRNQWAGEGLDVRGERLFLLAWEVMIPAAGKSEWGINVSTGTWNRPSVDFVFLDRRGTPWVMEVKRTIGSPKESWSALCQVTHRAAALYESQSSANIAAVFSSSPSGTEHKLNVAEAHRRFFGLDAALPTERFGTGVWRRLVGALHFSQAWSDAKVTFHSSSRDDLETRHLRDYKAPKNNKEFRRLLAVSEPLLAALRAEEVIEVILPPKLDC